MGHIRQNLNPILTQPTLTWRQDGALDTPELVGPRNESYFCPPDADLSDYPVGGNSGAKLKWKAVSEASFYVVQWCNNSSFNGPTLRSTRITGTEYELKYQTDVRLGEETFWRVMAYNTSGNVSPLSDSWSFTYGCKDLLSNAENETINCSAFNVELVLEGQEVVDAESQALYHLIINFNSEDKDGNPVNFISTSWVVRQSSNNYASLACTSDKTAVVEFDATTAEVVTVEATVTFSYKSSTFTCKQFKDVTIQVVETPSDLRHGIIVCDRGCNIYDVEIVDRYFDEPESSSSEECPDGTSSDPDLCDLTPPITADHCKNWTEVREFAPDIVVAGDIKCRWLSDGGRTLAVGTDVILGKIRAEDPDFIESSSSSSDDTCVNKFKSQWWIIEADENCGEERQSLNIVTNVLLCDPLGATSSEGTDCQLVDKICKTKVILPPGSIVCDEICGEAASSGGSVGIGTKCCDTDIPSILYMKPMSVNQTTPTSATCSCWDLTTFAVLTYNPMTDKWEGTQTWCNIDFTLEFYCLDDPADRTCSAFRIGVSNAAGPGVTAGECGAGGPNDKPTGCTCPPTLIAEWTRIGMSGNCCKEGGTAADIVWRVYQ